MSARLHNLRATVHGIGVSRSADIGKATVVVASAASESRRRWSQRLRETFAVCEVAEWRALEQVVADLQPSVVVLDLSLPHLAGGRDFPPIRHLSLSTKTLVLTKAPSGDQAIALLKAGVRGYHSRAIDPAHLKKAVEVVQKGEIWIHRRLIPRLVAEMLSLAEHRPRDPDARPEVGLEGLTTQQRRVADLIGRGASNKEIASQLNIAERTVRAHLTGAFRSLGVSDRLHLALVLTGKPRLWLLGGMLWEALEQGRWLLPPWTRS